MPDLRPILHINGLLLTGLAILMLIPAAVELAAGDADWFAFWASAVTTGFFGIALILANRRPNLALDIKQAFILTGLGWVLMVAFAALPFKFTKVSLSYAGSFFEAASGLTTTGATVLTGLDTMDTGILLWRGLLQLLGGLGIIVMAIAILPFLRVGGMQLLRTKSSDRMDKVLPRARQISISTATIYLVFVFICGVVYVIGGMDAFDAMIHAMTTVSTGGFSTSNASLSTWASPLIMWNAIVFMVLGSLPFMLYIKALRGNWRDIFADEQVRLFVALVLVTAVAMAWWLNADGKFGFGEGLVHAIFNIVSVVSTTGFMSTDYSLWGTFPVALFVLLLSVGGCTGSTAGGIKMLRFVVMWQLARTYIRTLITPHGVFQQRFNGQPVPPDVTISVVAFIGFYIAVLCASSIVLASMGLDIMTSFSASAACLGNVGPGLGAIVGPAGNFKALPEAAIWVLSADMLIGRLELFTVLVLFTRHFWRS